MNLPADWLNQGPFVIQQTMGLPEGIFERLQVKKFGPCLRVYFLGRKDAVALKMFAALDKDNERHLHDLETLKPEPSEIEFAVNWLLNREHSNAYLLAVQKLVGRLGHSMPNSAKKRRSKQTLSKPTGKMQSNVQ